MVNMNMSLKKSVLSKLYVKIFLCVTCHLYIAILVLLVVVVVVVVGVVVVIAVIKKRNRPVGWGK